MKNRYCVQGLPFKRSLEQLADSQFLKLLDREQSRALGTWLGSAPLGAVWSAVWVGEESLCKLTVQRVS